MVPFERCCLEGPSLFFFLLYGIPGPPFSLLVSKTHLTIVGHKCLWCGCVCRMGFSALWFMRIDYSNVRNQSDTACVSLPDAVGVTA